MPNKTTVAMKDAIMAVYADLQNRDGGGHAHFLAWATGEATEFYKLASKLIPLQVSGDPENPVNVVVTYRATDAKY